MGNPTRRATKTRDGVMLTSTNVSVDEVPFQTWRRVVTWRIRGFCLVADGRCRWEGTRLEDSAGAQGLG